jgi:hypothetical protein
MSSFTSATITSRTLFTSEVAVVRAQETNENKRNFKRESRREGQFTWQKRERRGVPL